MFQPMIVNIEDIDKSVFSLLFLIYSFFGWTLETAYRSFFKRQFVNAGYLTGPFIPIYGVSAMLIIVSMVLFKDISLLLAIAVSAIMPTVMELVTGFIALRFLGLRLWSYSDNRFNFKGLVCLKYSFIWALFTQFFYWFIFPLSIESINHVSTYYVEITALVGSIYLFSDLVFSTAFILDFRRRLEKLHGAQLQVRGLLLKKVLSKFNRLINAFPYLKSIIGKTILSGLNATTGTLIPTVFAVKDAIKTGVKSEDNEECNEEYNHIVEDILTNEEFLRLDEFFHHNSTILDHCKQVSLLSFRLAKRMKLDYVSTARGALLHDFFLYDWRNHDLPELAKEKFHGLEHPQIALNNAEKHFALNEIERDIILKHMWPLTLSPPIYKESYLVMLVDKYFALAEYADKIRPRRYRKSSKERKASL